MKLQYVPLWSEKNKNAPWLNIAEGVNFTEVDLKSERLMNMQ